MVIEMYVLTVGKLIKELKKLPKDLKVGYAHHDNEAGEIAGWVSIVYVEREKVEGGMYEKDSLGDECVILR